MYCATSRSSSGVYRPSPIAHRPSPGVCHPSPIAHRPSPSSGVHRLTPIAHRLSPSSAFTLIELVVVIAIVAILATGLIPLAELASQRSKEQELRAALRDMRTAIDAYKQATDEGRIERNADESGYPKTLEVLATGVPNAKDPDKHKIYFMRRIPRDPFFPDSEVPAQKTWGLRSYESPPDEPRDGKDVFDVYSLSEKKGLNGVPYKKW